MGKFSNAFATTGWSVVTLLSAATVIVIIVGLLFALVRVLAWGFGL